MSGIVDNLSGHLSVRPTSVGILLVHWDECLGSVRLSLCPISLNKPVVPSHYSHHLWVRSGKCELAHCYEVSGEASSSMEEEAELATASHGYIPIDTALAGKAAERQTKGYGKVGRQNPDRGAFGQTFSKNCF